MLPYSLLLSHPLHPPPPNSSSSPHQVVYKQLEPPEDQPSPEKSSPGGANKNNVPSSSSPLPPPVPPPSSSTQDYGSTIDFFGAGSVMGEMGILKQKHCNATVECETAVQVRVGVGG